METVQCTVTEKDQLEETAKSLIDFYFIKSDNTAKVTLRSIQLEQMIIFQDVKQFLCKELIERFNCN